MSVWKCIAATAAMLACLAGVAQANGNGNGNGNGVPWENLEFIAPAENQDFGDPPYRSRAVAAGQMVGVNPDDGSIITNAVHLLPLMARSLYAADVVDAGYFVGDGSQIENIDAQSLQGFLSPTVMPSAGTWDASGLTIRNARLSGNVIVQGEALTVASNLVVQGSISGDGSGLSNLAAGNSGELQFNKDGHLAANTNLFIHAETGKLAMRSVEGNLLRVYRNGVVDDGHLIFALREVGQTTELVMRRNGKETLRIAGDGSIKAAGSLEVGSLNVGSLTVGGGGESSRWFIPEAGDLSMGEFTDGE